MPHAVTLRLDDASAARIDALWDLLDAEGLSQSMKRLAYRPHVTVVLAGEIEVASTVAVLRKFAATQRAHRLAIAGLGVFPTPSGVLWAAPAVDRTLLDIHAGLHQALGWEAHAHYRPGTWVPHCTLAEGLDEAALGRAVQAVAARWQPFAATLDRIDLVRFRPVEILWQQPLRSHAAC